MNNPNYYFIPDSTPIPTYNQNNISMTIDNINNVIMDWTISSTLPTDTNTIQKVFNTNKINTKFYK